MEARSLVSRAPIPSHARKVGSPLPVLSSLDARHAPVPARRLSVCGRAANRVSRCHISNHVCPVGVRPRQCFFFSFSLLLFRNGLLRGASPSLSLSPFSIALTVTLTRHVDCCPPSPCTYTITPTTAATSLRRHCVNQKDTVRICFSSGLLYCNLYNGSANPHAMLRSPSRSRHPGRLTGCRASSTCSRVSSPP